VNVAEDVQAQLGQPRDARFERRAADMPTDRRVVQDVVRWPARDQDLRIIRDFIPCFYSLSYAGFAPFKIKRPIIEPRLPRRAVDAYPFDLSILIDQYGNARKLAREIAPDAGSVWKA